MLEELNSAFFVIFATEEQS